MKPHKIVKGIKSTFTILFVNFAILTLILPGCNQAPQQPQPSAPLVTPPENIPAKPPENQNLPSPDATGVAPTPIGLPIITEVSFPDGAPPLNHDARLIRTVFAKDIRLKNIRASFSLPEGLVLVSGNLTWQGDIAKGEKVEIISAVVKAVKTGNWTIDTYLYIDPREHGFFGTSENGSRGAVYVSVSEDSAQWGLTPPWYKKDGFVEPQPVPAKAPSSSLKAKLSLSKLPLVNEPIDLTLLISSQRYNTANSTAQIKLPDGAILLGGNLTWQGHHQAYNGRL